MFNMIFLIRNMIFDLKPMKIIVLRSSNHKSGNEKTETLDTTHMKKNYLNAPVN